MKKTPNESSRLHVSRAAVLSVFTETLPANYVHVQLWEQPELVPERTGRFLGRELLLESVLSGQARV